MDLFDTKKKAFAAMVAADLEQQRELLRQEDVAVVLTWIPFLRCG